MTAIKLENVYYAYEADEGEKPVNAVDGVSLEVEEGSFVAVVGHNGSGKSTLARLFNGLLLPDSGSVTVFGMDTKDEKQIYSIRSSVGMVFQNPDNQMVASVVEDDIAFGPENLGLPRDEIIRRVDRALEQVGMSEYRKSTPFRMSGGQKQRLAIAGVLAIRPKVIVLDESTAMLDPKGRREVMDVIHALNKEEKMTVIHITHYMEEVLEAERVIVMDGGKIAVDDTPRAVFARGEQLKKYKISPPLSFSYSKGTPFEKKALDNVSLTINDGEFVGIMGHTGSGKSTFIQHLNGLIKVQEGSVEVNGIRLTNAKRPKPDYKRLRATLGMVFQYPEYQLFDDTVIKDVSFGPKNMGYKKEEAEAMAREALRLVGLDPDEVGAKAPFELSG